MPIGSTLIHGLCMGQAQQGCHILPKRGHEKSGGHIIFSWKVGGHKSDWVATNFTEPGIPDQQKPWLVPLVNVNILIFRD